MVVSVTIGNCTLYHGDMREVLPTITTKANLLLSDPPYRLTAGGNTTGEMAGIFAKGAYDNSGELFPMVEWAEMAPLFWNALADDADAIVMTSDREAQDARGSLQQAGFRFHRLLIWDKGTVTPNRWFMPCCEFGLYMWKGYARTISNPSSKQLVYVRHTDETEHQTEKPVMLMRHWIENCSQIGAVILDPFMGSGSTLVAAELSGRQSIGIELQERWFDVACARVERAVKGLSQGDFMSAIMDGAA